YNLAHAEDRRPARPESPARRPHGRRARVACERSRQMAKEERRTDGGMDQAAGWSLTRSPSLRRRCATTMATRRRAERFQAHPELLPVLCRARRAVVEKVSHRRAPPALATAPGAFARDSCSRHRAPA